MLTKLHMRKLSSCTWTYDELRARGREISEVPLESTALPMALTSNLGAAPEKRGSKAASCKAFIPVKSNKRNCWHWESRLRTPDFSTWASVRDASDKPLSWYTQTKDFVDVKKGLQLFTCQHQLTRTHVRCGHCRAKTVRTISAHGSNQHGVSLKRQIEALHHYPPSSVTRWHSVRSMCVRSGQHSASRPAMRLSAENLAHFFNLSLCTLCNLCSANKPSSVKSSPKLMLKDEG